MIPNDLHKYKRGGKIVEQDKVRLSPDALGYKDRGKMKWIGLMLSDHAEALKEQKSVNHKVQVSPKSRQSSKVISTYLHQSYSNKKPLSIQLNIIKNGNYLSDINGFIVGFKNNSVFVKQRDESLTRIKLEDIRHTEWVDASEWFNKYTRQNKRL